MTLAVLVTVCALATMAILLRPQVGAVVIWPILFLYPHNWWYEKHFLPMNIGGDDLFCLLLFFGVALRVNVIRRVPIRLGYAFWVISAFTIISAVANVAGYVEGSGGGTAEAIKGALKPAVYWALFYAILHCIDNTRDLKIQLGAFAVSAACGAGLVILQIYFPDALRHFARPRPLTGSTGFTSASRGAGAFLNPNAAACVMGCSVFLSMTALRIQRALVVKAFTYALIVVLLVGILFTRSRSGLLALIVTACLMAIIGRGKSVLMVAIVGAVAIAAVFSDESRLFGERLTQAYNVDFGTAGENVTGRLETWRIYLGESSVLNYLVGQGAGASAVKFGMESHSAYISLLTVYGIGGATWGVVALVGFIRRVKSSLRSTDPVVCAVAAGCLWTLVFWGIYGFTADAISSPYTRYVLFYIVVLVDRAHAFRAGVGEQGREEPTLTYGAIPSNVLHRKLPLQGF